MKLINYNCENCGYSEELYLNSSEEIELGESTICPKCGEKMRRFNFKNNPQRVFIMDPAK